MAAAFDGCRLNRNGSNAQLFVFEVGSRIWQSDAKSHRILILLLPVTYVRARRAQGGCLAEFSSRLK